MPRAQRHECTAGEPPIPSHTQLSPRPTPSPIGRCVPPLAPRHLISATPMRGPQIAQTIHGHASYHLAAARQYRLALTRPPDPMVSDNGPATWPTRVTPSTHALAPTATAAVPTSCTVTQATRRTVSVRITAWP
ncbi:hypothetical protein FRC12_003184 [Ceratobasidium sp. 428]|nr:hypothetical protein FRC12_003184 [Ceratobasidium sp. 428]